MVLVLVLVPVLVRWRWLDVECSFDFHPLMALWIAAS